MVKGRWLLVAQQVAHLGDGHVRMGQVVAGQFVARGVQQGLEGYARIHQTALQGAGGQVQVIGHVGQLDGALPQPGRDALAHLGHDAGVARVARLQQFVGMVLQQRQQGLVGLGNGQVQQRRRENGAVRHAAPAQLRAAGLSDGLGRDVVARVGELQHKTADGLAHQPLRTGLDACEHRLGQRIGRRVVGPVVGPGVLHGVALARKGRAPQIVHQRLEAQHLRQRLAQRGAGQQQDAIDAVGGGLDTAAEAPAKARPRVRQRLLQQGEVGGDGHVVLARRVLAQGLRQGGGGHALGARGVPQRARIGGHDPGRGRVWRDGTIGWRHCGMADGRPIPTVAPIVGSMSCDAGTAGATTPPR